MVPIHHHHYQEEADDVVDADNLLDSDYPTDPEVDLADTLATHYRIEVDLHTHLHHQSSAVDDHTLDSGFGHNHLDCIVEVVGLGRSYTIAEEELGRNCIPVEGAGNEGQERCIEERCVVGLDPDLDLDIVR